jgi:uncharacterized protein YndB with AHSA1/START domain
MLAIEHELAVGADANQAFSAVATEAGIKAWWAKNSEVMERVGGRIELRFTKPEMSAIMKFELTALEPGRRVEWICKENTNPTWPGSRLVWTIQPAAEGSVVRFRHDGFTGGGPAYERTVAGWRMFMESLKSYLDTGVGHPAD